VASFRNEDVGGLDVAMNNPFGVRGIESIGHINRDGQQAFKVHRTASDGVFEGLAFEKFHGDKGQTAFFACLGRINASLIAGEPERFIAQQ
jgi:hypothetical protein